MSFRSFLNKKKRRVDDIISILLIIILVYISFYATLLAIMTLGVYCLTVLFIYAIYRAQKGIFDKDLKLLHRILNIIFGIVFICSSGYVLIYMFTRPNIPPSFFVYFLSIPMFLVGLAGFLKGLMVNVYSPLFRYLNVLIGAVTVFFTVIATFFAEVNVIFHLITLSTTMALNIILRSALYLSEYGLKLNSFRNFRLVWYIMDSIPMPQQENQTES
ncbi:MAG: hypothetical protein EAX91_07495 [Candidatus Lokiarchaeota archaeon]|nr:hypothetical protein [Candidatus Lokiarchaeota archaeon]